MKPPLLLCYFVRIGQEYFALTKPDSANPCVEMLHHALADEAVLNALNKCWGYRSRR